jgi:hypothetical protein
MAGRCLELRPHYFPGVGAFDRPPSARSSGDRLPPGVGDPHFINLTASRLARSGESLTGPFAISAAQRPRRCCASLAHAKCPGGDDAASGAQLNVRVDALCDRCIGPQSPARLRPSPPPGRLCRPCVNHAPCGLRSADNRPTANNHRTPNHRGPHAAHKRHPHIPRRSLPVP